jgi:hypothetical protein
MAEDKIRHFEWLELPLPMLLGAILLAAVCTKAGYPGWAVGLLGIGYAVHVAAAATQHVWTSWRPRIALLRPHALRLH